MSVIDRVLQGLRRVPRGFPADGRQLGIGLAAALDAQRARGAEPLRPETGGRDARPVEPSRVDVPDRATSTGC